MKKKLSIFCSFSVSGSNGAFNDKHTDVCRRRENKVVERAAVPLMKPTI